MAKKKNNISGDEFKKLSPEEQSAYVEKLKSDLAASQEATKSAKKELEKATEKEKVAKPASFKVEPDEENDIEGGTYEFQSPTFTWDDGSIINAHALVKQAEGKGREATKAQEILSELVSRGSVKRKED